MKNAFSSKISVIFLSFIVFEATVASIAFYEITQSQSDPAQASAKASNTTQKAQQKWDGYAPYALYQTLENL